MINFIHHSSSIIFLHISPPDSVKACPVNNHPPTPSLRQDDIRYISYLYLIYAVLRPACSQSIIPNSLIATQHHGWEDEHLNSPSLDSMSDISVSFTVEDILNFRIINSARSVSWSMWWDFKSHTSFQSPTLQEWVLRLHGHNVAHIWSLI